MIELRWWLLLGLAVGYGLYHPLNLRPSKYYWSLPFDSTVKLIPGWVWVYVTYFLMLPGSILSTWTSTYAIPLMLSLVIAKAISLPIWYFWPNGVKRPALPNPKNLSEKLLATIYRHDNDTNGCPSSHVFTSVIGGWFLGLTFPAWQSWFLLWAALICISTLYTKQHYVIDVICGVGLAIISIALATIIL
jgi:membrane-associated phospholipid phosphatase